MKSNINYMKQIQNIHRNFGYSVNELLKKGFPRSKTPITVLITNYNYGNYLEKCIESVFLQGVDFFQVVVVDDNSSDNSREILNKLSSKFKDLQVIYNEKNLGINGILNKYIPKIKSEFVIMLDADDWLGNDFHDNLYELLKKNISLNDKVAFAYSDCILVDESGKEISRGKSCDFEAELVKTKSFIPRPSILKTKVLKSILPLDESLANGAKHDMWKKIVALGYIGVYFSNPLFYYRMHQKNISGIGKKILLETSNDLYTEAILSGYWRTL